MSASQISCSFDYVTGKFMLYLYSKISNLRSLSCWPITSQFTQLLANHVAAIKAHREHFDMIVREF